MVRGQAFGRLLALAVLASAVACAHAKIPGTTIDDTDENRKIIELVEEYRRALEARDAPAILAMVSPRFYEDNGNTDRSDDYDYTQLEDSLTQDFGRTKKIQVELRVDDVEVNDDRAYAYLYYNVRAQSEFPSGMKWKTNSDRARLEFERTGDRWLIISGL